MFIVFDLRKHPLDFSKHNEHKGNYTCFMQSSLQLHTTVTNKICTAKKWITPNIDLQYNFC